MKLMGFFMIITSGVIFGFSKYMEMEKLVKVLECYENLLNEIKIGISYSLDDIHLILAESDNLVAVRIRKSASFPYNLDAAWKETSESFFRKSKEEDFIERFIDEFSKTDMEASQIITDNFINKVHLKYVSEKEKLLKKGKIYIIYSVFISFAIAMLLI